MNPIRKTEGATVLGVVLVAAVLCSAGAIAQGAAPEIVFVGFPAEIEANGMPYYGYISFKDSDADVVQVQIEIPSGSVGGLVIAPGTAFDPGMLGKSSGTVDFTVTASVAGACVLRVRLLDDAGNPSAPKDVFFTVVGGQENASPVARFTISAATAGAGENVAFDGSTSFDPEGSLTGLAWDFGDGSGAVGQQVSHAYSSGGTYVVTLTVTDGEGATGAVSHSIDVACCDINLWGELSHLVAGLQEVATGRPVCYYSSWFTDTREGDVP